MATKPVTSFVHATDLLFGAGPAFGFTTKLPVATPAQGFVPGIGIAAEQVNDLFNIAGSWITDWLLLGSSLGAEDAHIVETDATGLTLLARLAVGPHTTAASPLNVVASGGLRAITCTALGGSGIQAALFDGDGAGEGIEALGGATGDGVFARASGSGHAVRASVFGGTGSALFAVGDALALSPTIQADPGGVNPLRGPWRLFNSNAPSGAVVDAEFYKPAGIAGFGRAPLAHFDNDGAIGGGGGGFQKHWTTFEGYHYQATPDGSFGPSNSGVAVVVQTLTLDPGATTPTRPETGSKVMVHWQCRIGQTAGAVGADDLFVDVQSTISGLKASNKERFVIGLGQANGKTISGFFEVTMGAGIDVITIEAQWAAGGGVPTWTVDQARITAQGNHE